MNIDPRAIQAGARMAFQEMNPMYTLGQEDREDYEAIARAVIHAAAPYLYAQALREASKTIDADGRDVNWDEDNYFAGKRHASNELLAMAYELDPHE